MEQNSVAVRGNNGSASAQEPLSTKLDRIAETARKYPDFEFRTIAHLITVEMLERSFWRLRRNAAAGVDEMTAQEYAGEKYERLRGRLIDLHRRMKEGRYRAQPMKRVHIPKEDGTKRPLSIPVLEDKIAQKAVVDLLNCIYEQDFLPSSYGYRAGRSAHQALEAIQKQIMLGKVSYILEADIQDYFGSIVRMKLMELIQKRIGQRSLLRLIGKWLHVGAIDEGRLLVTKSGIHQGSVVSPLLANIYLHEVLDLWMEQEVRPRMRGEIKLCRFADDFIICFQFKEDAKRVEEVLPKRFEKFGLKLNPKKTKLIEFGPLAWVKSKQADIKPETFDFLGLTHIQGTSRRGKFTVQVKTMRKRQKRSLAKVNTWCRRNLHQDLKVQSKRLGRMLEGHFNYYGRRSNYRSLVQFHSGVKRIWKYWLSRRSNDGCVTWERMNRILSQYKLPRPRIISGTRTESFNLAVVGELI